MDRTKIKISSGQFLALLLCSRITVTLTYSLNNSEHTSSGSDFVNAIILIPIMLLLGIPAYILIKQNKNKSLIDRAYDISSSFGNLLSVLYSLYFLFIPIASISRFNIFITSTIQTDKSMFYYAVLIMLPVCFATIKGIEPIARAGTIGVVLGGLILLTITIILIPRFNILNITAPALEEKSNMFSMLKILTSNCNETVALLILFPMVKGNTTKTYIKFSFISGIIITILLFTIAATLGAYAKLQSFPYYTAYGVAELGSLKRLDAIHSAVWLIGVFIKSATFTYTSCLCLERIIPHKFRTLTIVIVGIIITVLASIISGNYGNFDWLYGSVNLLRSLLVFSLAIPLFVIIASNIKRKRRVIE